MEAPPFLPDWALPPSSSGLLKGSWLLSRGLWDVAEGQEPCDPRASSAAHTVPGEEGDGENTDLGGHRGGGWGEKEAEGLAEREARCRCMCPGAVGQHSGEDRLCESAAILALSLATVESWAHH